jgi:hypothetical protein
MEVAALQMRVVHRYSVFRVGAGKRPMRVTAYFGASRFDDWHCHSTNETQALPHDDWIRLYEWFHTNREPLLEWLALCPFAVEGGRGSNLLPVENPL